MASRRCYKLRHLEIGGALCGLFPNLLLKSALSLHPSPLATFMAIAILEAKSAGSLGNARVGQRRPDQFSEASSRDMDLSHGLEECSLFDATPLKTR